MPQESLNIKEIIKNAIPYLKSVKAENNVKKWANKDVKITREIDLKYDIEANSVKHFVVVVIDKISFSPEIGPFDIEVQIECLVYLQTEKTKEEIEKYLGIEENKEYFRNACLPHSSIIVSFLTDILGYTPLVLTPAKV